MKPSRKRDKGHSGLILRLREIKKKYKSLITNPKTRVWILFLITSLSFLVVVLEVRSIPESEQGEERQGTDIHLKEPDKNGTDESKTVDHHPESNFGGIEKALLGMKETNDLLINWSILLLTGTMGLTIVAKIVRIKDNNGGFVLVGPVWVFLASSLYFASYFKQSLTYQLAFSDFDFVTLNDYLYLQLLFFKYSLIPLAILAFWYLAHRLLLLEEPVKED